MLFSPFVLLATYVTCCLATNPRCWGLNEGFFSKTSYTPFPVLHANDHPQLQLQRAFLPGPYGGDAVCMTKLFKLSNLLTVVINHQHLYAIDSDTNAVLWEQICDEFLHIIAIDEQRFIMGCRANGVVAGVDASTGAVRWQMYARAETIAFARTSGAAILPSFPAVLAVSVATGQVMWNVSVINQMEGATGWTMEEVAVDDKSFVFCLARFQMHNRDMCKLIVISLSSGSRIAAAGAVNAAHCFVSVTPDGHILMTYENVLRIYHLDHATSRLLEVQTVNTPRHSESFFLRSYISVPPAFHHPSGIVVLCDSACHVYFRGPTGAIDHVVQRPAFLGRRLGCRCSLQLTPEALFIQYRYALPPSAISSFDMTTKKVLWTLQLSALRHAAAFFGCDAEWYMAGTAIPPEVPNLEVQLYQAVQAKVRSFTPAYIPRGTGAHFVIVLTAALAFNEHMRMHCVLQEAATGQVRQLDARMLSNDAFECSVRSLGSQHHLTLVATWPDDTELRLPAGNVSVYEAVFLQPDTGGSEAWTRVTIHGLGFAPCAQGVPCYCLTTLEGGTAIQKAHGLDDTQVVCAIPPRPTNASGWEVAVHVAVGQRDLQTPVPLRFFHPREPPVQAQLVGVMFALTGFLTMVAGVLSCLCKGGVLLPDERGEVSGLWSGVFSPPPVPRSDPVPILQPAAPQWSVS